MTLKNIANIAVLAAAATLAWSGTALAQKAFPSADAAANAFIDAVATSDDAALRDILGADWKRFIPTDDIDQEDVYAFLADTAKSRRIIAESPDKAALAVGTGGWTLPIPIVRSAAGWRFDARAGAEEMRTRRIGRNELAAIQVALAYYDAQKDYALKDYNGDGVLEYAQKGFSTPGKKDGLYWAAKSGEEESPLGPRFADAQRGEPYHGYSFRILTAQGKNAPGGPRSYVNKGRMTNGFGLAAWPAKYGETGIMTFIVNHNGIVYQKDLGPGTGAIASAMTRYDPDQTWTKVSP